MIHGRFPRLRWLRWGLFIALIVLIVGATGGQAFNTVTNWLSNEYDRLPWYATRITALLAYLALSGAVIYGLLLSTKILDASTHRFITLTLHQDLAGIGVALALVHGAVLMLDRTMPYSPVEVLVPFAGPYRPLWVGIGQVALGLSLLVFLSFYVRKRIGTRAWRLIHYLSFLAFLGATAHGLMAGSDTSADWVYGTYLAATVIVMFLMSYRIILAAAGGKAAAPPPRVAAPSVAEASPPVGEVSPPLRPASPAARAALPPRRLPMPPVGAPISLLDRDDGLRPVAPVPGRRLAS